MYTGTGDGVEASEISLEKGHSHVELAAGQPMIASYKTHFLKFVAF